jgi:hypothetical protein
MYLPPCTDAKMMGKHTSQENDAVEDAHDGHSLDLHKLRIPDGLDPLQIRILPRIQFNGLHPCTIPAKAHSKIPVKGCFQALLWKIPTPYINAWLDLLSPWGW